jgi:hypothetical protein
VSRDVSPRSWEITGTARGANGEHLTVTFSGIPEQPLAPQREAVRESLYTTFPDFFGGVDPIHVEVYSKEATDAV